MQDTEPEGNNFWSNLDQLVVTCKWRIDRPRGAAHPRYPALVYPVDYGYLEETRSPDGGGIDIWVGSLPEKRINAIVCTVDMYKRDSEIKLLIGCTRQEIQQILQVHNDRLQSGILIERPTEKNI
jgi:inorganic pyrophosphatase